MLAQRPEQKPQPTTHKTYQANHVSVRFQNIHVIKQTMGKDQYAVLFACAFCIYVLGIPKSVIAQANDAVWDVDALQSESIFFLPVLLSIPFGPFGSTNKAHIDFRICFQLDGAGKPLLLLSICPTRVLFGTDHVFQFLFID
jgi:hypothetical protein